MNRMPPTLRVLKLNMFYPFHLHIKTHLAWAECVPYINF